MSYIMCCLGRFNCLTVWNFSVIGCGFACITFRDLIRYWVPGTRFNKWNDMRWKLILEEFGSNIQHINWVENIVADALNRWIYKSVNNYKPIRSKVQCRADELLAMSRKKNNKYFSTKPLKCAKRTTNRSYKWLFSNSAHTFWIGDTVTPRNILKMSR